MFPETTISNAAKYVGAIVGPDDEVRAKEFSKKKKQIINTLDNLRYLKDARAEYQILRYCGIAWARYLPTIMPRRGVIDEAVEAYVRGIDAAISDELARLLGDEKVKKGIGRAEISLPTSMGGLGIPSLAMITPGAYMSSLITSTHNLQLHSPKLHKHLMNSTAGEDQFFASYTYDQVMEHHNWHDGSDKRGKPSYDLPNSVRKAMSSAIPTEKQLNSNMYSRIYKQVMMERSRRIRTAKDKSTEKEEKIQRARLISAGGKFAYQWLQIHQQQHSGGSPR